MGCVGRSCEWLGLLAAAEPTPTSAETVTQSGQETLATEILGMVCVTGAGGCGAALVATTSSDSSFHNEELREISRQIDSLLAPLRNRGVENGLELAFVDTKQGFLLAWVEHPEEIPAGKTLSFSNNSAEEIAAALDLAYFDGGGKA